jgi:hypothetical protein
MSMHRQKDGFDAISSTQYTEKWSRDLFLLQRAHVSLLADPPGSQVSGVLLFSWSAVNNSPCRVGCARVLEWRVEVKWELKLVMESR